MLYSLGKRKKEGIQVESKRGKDRIQSTELHLVCVAIKALNIVVKLDMFEALSKTTFRESYLLG